MSVHAKLVCALTLSSLVVACGSGPSEMSSPPEEYPLAFYHEDCAPWDGPAVTLYLVQSPMTRPWEPSAPYARLSVYEPIPSLVGSTVEWQGDAIDTGHAVRCRTEQSCQVAADVRLRVRQWQASEGRLTGDVELVLPDGSRVAGGFQAELLDVQAICG